MCVIFTVLCFIGFRWLYNLLVAVYNWCEGRGNEGAGKKNRGPFTRLTDAIVDFIDYLDIFTGSKNVLAAPKQEETVYFIY